MTMSEFTAYLYAWNDWFVFPVLVVIAIVVHYRCRKTSTLLLLIASALALLGYLLTWFYSGNPLHTLYLAGIAIGFTGGILGFVGLVLYVRKDYVAKSNKT